MKQAVRPFFRIASRTVYKPLLCNVQTDGAFYQSTKLSRTAVLIQESSPIELVKTYFDHNSLYESEWASVLDGMRLSYSLGIRGISLENDNLSVIRMLTMSEEEKENDTILWKNQEHIFPYYQKIFNIANKLDWVEVRWIPCEINNADDLFRRAFNKTKNVRVLEPPPHPF